MEELPVTMAQTFVKVGVDVIVVLTVFPVGVDFLPVESEFLESASWCLQGSKVIGMGDIADGIVNLCSVTYCIIKLRQYALHHRIAANDGFLQAIQAR